MNIKMMAAENSSMGIKTIYNTNQILIFYGYVKVRDSLYTRVTIWVKAILNHIDPRQFYLGMKVLA